MLNFEGLSDLFIGVLLLGISLLMPTGCLILIVKILKSILHGKKKEDTFFVKWFATSKIGLIYVPLLSTISDFMHSLKYMLVIFCVYLL